MSTRSGFSRTMVLTSARKKLGKLRDPRSTSVVDTPARSKRAARTAEGAEPQTTVSAPASEETELDDAVTPEGDPDERRLAVHEEGRAAVEEMRGVGEPASEEPQ